MAHFACRDNRSRRQAPHREFHTLLVLWLVGFVLVAVASGALLGRTLRRSEERVGDRSSAGGKKFVIYRDLGDGYRRRLRSQSGETPAASASGHRENCVGDIRCLLVLWRSWTGR